MDRQVTIKNKLGLHARPAMAFVDVATQFQAAIKVCSRDQTVRQVDHADDAAGGG